MFKCLMVFKVYLITELFNRAALPAREPHGRAPRARDGPTRRSPRGDGRCLRRGAWYGCGVGIL
jgi:hypothetical protein